MSAVKGVLLGLANEALNERCPDPALQQIEYWQLQQWIWTGEGWVALEMYKTNQPRDPGAT